MMVGGVAGGVLGGLGTDRGESFLGNVAGGALMGAGLGAAANAGIRGYGYYSRYTGMGLSSGKAASRAAQMMGQRASRFFGFKGTAKAAGAATQAAASSASIANSVTRPVNPIPSLSKLPFWSRVSKFFGRGARGQTNNLSSMAYSRPQVNALRGMAGPVRRNQMELPFRYKSSIPKGQMGFGF
jgi:hypothetical protein